MSVTNKEPLSHKEIKELRERPIAGVLYLLRLMANYDNAREETKKAKSLSSRHYQHHVNSVKECRKLKKKLDEAKEKIKHLKYLADEAEKSRCFMIESAAKSHVAMKKITEHINALPGDEIYDGIAGRNDVICSLSKKDFEELLFTLADDDEE